MPTTSQRDVLSTSELRSALEALSQADLFRLSKKSVALAPGTGMSADDLLQEALRRALEEDEGRKCPRDVGVIIFLGNAMRSIASAERKKWAREGPIGAMEDDELDLIANAPDPGPSPEQQALDRIDYVQTVSRIEALFADDPQCLAIVVGDMEGWSPDEIREMEPMSEKEFVAARKRFRRAFLREFPRGRTDE